MSTKKFKVDEGRPLTAFAVLPVEAAELAYQLAAALGSMEDQPEISVTRSSLFEGCVEVRAW